MNDRDETFLGRWSRVKRQAAREEAKSEPATRQPNVGPGAEAKQPAHSDPAAEKFDISSLPPVDSITAATDIRDFLRAGVPAELTKAALRQVWTSDPAIRDFIGIAENQWDFTDPTAIPGFGPMAPTDNVADLVAQAMGRLEAPSEATEAAGSSDVGSMATREVATPVSSADSAPIESAADEPPASAATQQSDDPPPRPRRHGGALPA